MNAHMMLWTYVIHTSGELNAIIDGQHWGEIVNLSNNQCRSWTRFAGSRDVQPTDSSGELLYYSLADKNNSNDGPLLTRAKLREPVAQLKYHDIQLAAPKIPPVKQDHSCFFCEMMNLLNWL